MSGRLERLRELLADRGLDGALVTHPSNRFYLSGFSADDAPPTSTAALLVGPTSALLLTGGANVPWARADVDPGVEVTTWGRPWEPSVAKRIMGLTWRRVGFEEDAISFAAHRDLSAALKGAALIPLDGSVDALRATKDDAELATMAEVIRLTDAVFVAATADLAAGTTERELAWRVERELRERGADGPAFPTIVAAGPHAARPHHRPTDRPIAPGEPVIIDMGAKLAGYHGDLTRTVWVGDPAARLVELYGIVAEANDAARAVARAGLPVRDLDAAARTVIERAGYGDHLPHGISHGLGVRVHEAPMASRTSDETLAAGNVITVEPGIYLDGWGGVRVEDVGVVEPTGFRTLTTAPKLDPRLPVAAAADD